MLGATSYASYDCVFDFVEDGFKLYSCLTDEELAMFQENFLPYLVP